MILKDVSFMNIRNTDLSDFVAIIPVGSFEQHSNMPFTMDTDVPDRISNEIENAFPDRILLCPSFMFGNSGHHVGFNGTISISKKSLELVLNDIINSVLRWGVRRVILLNGHGGKSNGGNIEVLKFLSKKLSFQDEVSVELLNWWDMISSEDKKLLNFDFAHCGFEETSLGMFLRKDFKITGSLGSPIPDEVSACSDWSKLSSNGNFGDSSLSNPVIGKKIIEHCVSRFKNKLVIEWVF